MRLDLHGGHTLLQGDCLERMKDIPDGSVDMVLTDPPYGTVRGLDLDGWDGDRVAWDTALDPQQIFEQISRVLRPNGTACLFAQEPYTGALTTGAVPGLPFRYRMVWLKNHFANALGAKKAPVSYTEDVCVFAKVHTKHDFKGFHPVRPYAKRFFEWIGRSKKEVFAATGGQGACHFMRYDSAQFALCTRETYEKLETAYAAAAMPGFTPFAELARADRAFRERLITEMAESAPKRFNLPPGAKFKSNVLEYRKDGGGVHPTQKPVALMADLIHTYTNEGETVLDFTMGSGSTGVAAAQTGRCFIGIELDPRYFGAAVDRISNALLEITT